MKISRKALTEQNKQLKKPRWKCPSCGTFNGMTDNCKKCKKDCFNFNQPPDLVQPGEKEEESDKTPVPQPKQTQSKPQVSDFKSPANKESNTESGVRPVKIVNDELYWLCLEPSCKTVNETYYKKPSYCTRCGTPP